MYKIVDCKKTDRLVAVKVHVGNELWAKEVGNANLCQLNNVKIPGFRKGKAPIEYAKKYINPQKLFQTAFIKCVQKLLPVVSKDKIIQEENVFMNIAPEVKIGSISETELIFELEFNRFPEINLPDYKSVSIVAKRKRITDEDVKTAVKKILDDYSQMVVKTDGHAQNSDVAVVTYVGKIAGKLDDRFCARCQEIIIESDRQFIPGFVDKIIGMNVGEEKKFILQLPNDYMIDLPSREIEFKLKLDELKVVEYPEVDKLMVEKLTGGEINSVSDFNMWVKKKLELNEENNYNYSVQKELFEYLLANAKFSHVPTKIVDLEYAKRVKNLNSYFKQQSNVDFTTAVKNDGLDVDEVEKSLRSEVEKSVKLLLLLKKIAKVEQLYPTASELDQYRKKLKDSKNMQDFQLSMLDNAELSDYFANIKVIDALRKWNCLEA